LLLHATKALSNLSKGLRLGAGATWPGEIALRFDPFILSDLAKQLDSIVLVAGTNGKTTTAKMITEIIKENGKKGVIHNETGANLLNGITSVLIQDTNALGKLQSTIGIFEVDENSLPLLLKEFTPNVVVLLNLFRDQLDRYGEVDLIANNWLEALKHLPKSTTLIINADDPHLAYIGKQISAKVKYFGLNDKKYFLSTTPHAADTLYCPNCGKRLHFSGHYLSHLGEWNCEACNFKHPKNDLSGKGVKSPLPGLYNVYNTLAALLTVKELGIDVGAYGHTPLRDFTPAFGRQEEFIVGEKKVKIFLSKNPAGFNASLSTVLSQNPHAILFVLNDQVPDGRDVSWIWDVDFEMIADSRRSIATFVSGDRVYDMGVRLKYAGLLLTPSLIYADLKNALKAGLDAIGVGETLYVLPTYSAMLEVRKILGGRKIL